MKSRTVFVCSACGAQSPKWVGRCTECGAWSSLSEEAAEPPSRAAWADPGRPGPVPLSEVRTDDQPRLPSGIGELDRILGGGIVPGSVTLIGGDPGIGKSTLLLQVSDSYARAARKVLYVTAEESAIQTRMRADRLGASATGVFLACETELERILGFVKDLAPDLVVIDSIQMVYRSDLPGAPGTVTQVRECTTELVSLAKRKGISLFVIGHVTKEGSIAGPRTLEHLVDTVLYFEGDRFQNLRVLRAVKNRYGPTDEIGLLEMGERGLVPVADPARLFITAGRPLLTGTTVLPSHVGSRILLVEVQALTTRAVYGIPARKVSGVDPNRVALILAVLEKRAGMTIGMQDVFVNAAGGIRVDEPAADLAIAVTVASSFLDRPVAAATAVAGEVGLGGEIRPVPRATARIEECARLGIARILLPAETAPGPTDPRIEVRRVATVREAIDAALGS